MSIKNAKKLFYEGPAPETLDETLPRSATSAAVNNILSNAGEYIPDISALLA